jgi:16S rRNA (uracil1498-N3)-methyltransferase
MRHFFVDPDHISSDQVTIDAEQTKHIEKVLRLKPGEKVQVFDGRGREYTVILTGKENGLLVGSIICEETALPSKLHLTLIQGIAKGDKMDTIIQKAVEVGCSCIIPVATQYTIVHLDRDRAGHKAARWQTIAREACKQSRRSIVPEVKGVIGFNQMLEQLQGTGIMLYENEEHTRLRTVLHQLNQAVDSINLIIGPEGGFSPEEVQQARRYGVNIAGLGPYILRTETAGLAAAALILYEYGELG